MFIIEKRSRQATEGETCSGKQSMGEGQDYHVRHDQNLFTALIRYNSWRNGERDITCLEIDGNARLGKVVGRLRLGIEKYSEIQDVVTLKTAIIKSAPPAHATLHKRDLEFYQDIMDLNLVAELSKFGECKVDTKEVLLNTTGRNRSDFCMLFKKENEEIPIAAFVLTRIVPILYSEKPKFKLHILQTELKK